MSETKRRPWLKFYTSDWRSDPGLRMCSFAARGLWADMLTLMHEAQEYGHLLINGISPSAADLASLLGGTAKEIDALLGMLEARGVFSRTEAGVIFSRRMLRDAAQAEKDKLCGKTGGNPYLRRSGNPPPKGGVNPPDNHPDNQTVNGEDKAHSQRPESEERKRNPASSLVRARRTPLAGPMPTLNDPPEFWRHLADRYEAHFVDGVQRPVVAGFFLDITAREVCEAAKINGYARPVDWTPMIGWMREGFDPAEHILPAIKRIAARSGYEPPRFLSYFDDAIRGRAA